ncbi:hypothetical protein B7463_g5924, partial [Scytalidium lignicola]
MSRPLPPFPTNVPTAPLVTISLRKLEANDQAEHARLFEVAKAIGFFYLDMRSSPTGESLLQEADLLFALMENFFGLPLEEKQKYDFAAKKMYYGYKGMGKEVVDGKGTKDRNEIYNISKDDLLSIMSPLSAPGVITSHRKELKSYVETNNSILSTLYTSLSTSLHLDPNTLSSLHRLSAPSGCHVRFICAPPATEPESAAAAALGEHTDFGSMTILMNRLGGLQVQLPRSEEWVYVVPVPGCAIVNLGDAMVKFTGGILRSNLHRVLSPPGEQAREVRHSLVYFSRPEHDVMLKMLEGGLIDELGVDDGDAKGGVRSEDWLSRRHLGRKIEFFKGEESWEQAKGTEARL